MMKANEEARPIPMPLGGMHAGGAPQLIPEGATRLMQNILRRPGPAWEKRPPLALADTVTTQTVLGFMLWDDVANGITRTVEARTRNATAEHELRVTASSGGAAFADTFNSSNALQGAVSSFTNYRGILYYAMSDDIATAVGLAIPSGLFSFDGSAITENPLGGETLKPRCLATFIERIFLGHVRATVTNLLGASDAYDLTGWSNVSATAENITNGATITGRLTPTATTGAQSYKRNVYTVPASTEEKTLLLLSQLRNTSPTYAMPVTVEVYYSEIWVASTAYALGDIRVPTAATGNGFHYRCTVAGTSAAGEPVWPTNIGDTIVDGAVTWVCAGKDAAGSQPTTLQTRTEKQAPTTLVTRATIGAQPRPVKLGVRIKFGTTSVGTIERHSIEVSFRDGKANGAAGKANWGQQLTAGKFSYPFFNVEGAAAATITLDPDLYWTDAGDPNTVKADYSFKLRETPGPIMAMVVVGNRLLVFKERGMWVFAPSENANIPIVREQFIAGVSCRGPRAVTVRAGVVYIAGQTEVYEYEVGGLPRPIMNDAMRTRFFSGTPNGIALPLHASIAFDDRNNDLYVSSDINASETAVLDTDTGAWSVVRTNSRELGGLLWNPSLLALYCWRGSTATGVESAYLRDNTTAANDTGISGSPVVEAIIQPRPVSTLYPRKEIAIQDVGLLHMTTGAQTGQTSKIEVSLDGGATWTKSITFEMPTTASATVADRAAIRSLQQSGHNLCVRLTHSGKGGSDMLRIAAMDVLAEVLGDDERSITNATITAVSL